MVKIRPDGIPPSSFCYRRLGPFDEQTIPRGLLAVHRLKSGVWVMLTIEAGAIIFVWDDSEGGRSALAAGDQFVVPPCIPHHVEIVGEVRLSLDFYR